MWSGISIGGRLKRENLLAFCSDLVLFSFATSVLFTPLPIFFSKDLSLTESLVFAMFVLNSMELIPEGEAGLFNVLVSIGGVCGSFIGPFLAQTVGFLYVFLVTGIIFLLSYVAFKFS